MVNLQALLYLFIHLHLHSLQSDIVVISLADLLDYLWFRSIIISTFEVPDSNLDENNSGINFSIFIFFLTVDVSSGQSSSSEDEDAQRT